MDLERTITGIFALTFHLTKRLLFSRKLMITILIAAFVASVMAYAGSQDVDPLDDGTDLMDALILFFFMPVTAMIFGTSLMRDEIDDRSITHVATSPLDRVYAYMGYYLPLVIAVIVSMVIVTVAGFIAFFSQQGFTSDAMEVLLEFVALVSLGSVVYSSLFLAISIVVKKPVFLGLFYAFVWEGFISSLPGVIEKISIKYYLRSLGSHWVDWGSISGFDDASSAGGSVAVMIILVIVFLAFGAFMFRREEIS
jgi:ABC-2 type transport system permease protein